MEASFAIFEITLTGPNYRVGNFRFSKTINILSFLKNFEKITKNVISRKLQKIEQSYLEASFAIFEITLTGPNYRVGNFRFLKTINILSFLKNFEKITKNVISQKLQRIEQSYLEARFAISESTPTGPNYRVGNFRFLKTNHNLSFQINFEKSQKTSYLENYKELSSHIWRQVSQSLRLLRQDPTTGLGISDSLVFFYLERSEPIRFACDMRLKTRYSLEATTKIPPLL